jgi:TonB-linked SusC/RagA family outer membrane protein
MYYITCREQVVSARKFFKRISLLLTPQISKAMKITFVFLTAFLLNVSAKNFGQQVTLNVKNVAMDKVFREIEKQTGYGIYFTKKMLKDAGRITLVVKNKPVKDVLQLCFSKQPFTFSIENNAIIISVRPASADRQPDLSTAIPQALISIHGIVKDANGNPLAGVSVVIKGTGKGTSTSADGRFTIDANAGDVLEFSFVGYEKRSVKVGPSNNLSIVMIIEATMGNEVVVVGYGTTKKSDLTGAVATAPIGDMQKAPVRSFTEALAGRIAGVVVSSVDGQPGSTNNIVIRGNNSITGDNSPLYVIDGFPNESINSNSINPDDIESISVLKDASATAIYGARGANGVIVITTKTGKVGPPVVSFSTYYGIQKVNHSVPLMDPYNFVKYQLENSPGDTTVNFSGAYYFLKNGVTLDSYRDSANIDWQSRLFRSAPMKNYDLSVSGGNAQTKYTISGNILDQDGVIINSNYKRYQGRFSLNQNLGKNFKTAVNVNYSHLEQSGQNPAGGNGSATSTLMYSTWGFRPFGKNLLDDPFDDNISSANDYRFNPIINQQHILRQNNTNNLAANAFVEYAITKDLKLKISGGINTLINQSVSFNDTLTSSGNPRATFNKGVNGSVNYSTTNVWLNENTLTYNKRFNKNNSLNLLAGVTEQGRHTSLNGLSNSQLPTQATNVSWLSSGAGVPTITSDASLNTIASFLSRANYTYHSDYLFTASFRADGSSKFSPENHWSYFPSGAVAWKFGNNPLIKNIKAISDGKLRLSYGLTGNNRVSDFPYLTQYSISTVQQGYTFNNLEQSGLIPQTLGNPNLKWETTAQWDLGLDMGFLNGRIDLTVDLYKKVTKDLLLNARIPTSYGYNSIFKNIGKVQNQGLEISINTVNIRRSDFSWNTNFNIAFNANKVLALTENQNSDFAGAPYDNSVSNIPAFLFQVGKPLGLMYGPIWDGVYQYSDFDKSPSGTYALKATIPTNGNVRSTIQPGDIKYRDLNGDGIVDRNDFTVIGRGLPIHTGGITNDFNYKGFNLSVFFQWSYGNDILNANRLVFEGNNLGKTGLNQYASYENRWTPDNPSNTLYRAGLNSQGPIGNSFSSRVVEDGSYLRLKTISLGYNLPKDLFKKLGIRNLNFYVAAQNLYTWTKYTGNDPEVSIFNSVLSPGVDYSAYPRAKTITVGLKASL